MNLPAHTAALLALALACATAAHAQQGKIVVIIACDTTPQSGLGNHVFADQANVSDLFKGNVPESQLDVRVINGEDISKESILGAIQKAEVRTEDTLVFYYSGHGAFDSEKKQYIQLPGGVPLLRSDVDAELNQKNAHLKVLLTDTCSTFYNINKSSKSDHRKKVPRKDLAADRVSPLFQAMFFETNGYVSISGTKPGESGFMDAGDQPTIRPRGRCSRSRSSIS